MNPYYEIDIWYGLIKNRGGITIKRHAILGYFILCAIFLISCSNGNSQDQSQQSPAASTESPVSSAESPVPSAEPSAGAIESPVASTENKTPSVGDKFLAFINKGKVNDTELTIGDSTEHLLQQRGEPASMDYFEGGQYFNYGTVTYFTDANYDESNKLVHGRIGLIGFSSGYEVFGLKLGEADLKQMEAALGTDYVAQSPEENSESYLLSEMWSYEYRTDHYSLIFYSDTQNGVMNGALLLKNEE